MIPRHPHRERGAAAVELALFLPLLVFAFAAVTSVVSLILDYHALTDISSTGARYATRAGLDPEDPGVYAFRRSVPQVRAYVSQLASREGLEVEAITVSPAPNQSFPGTPITVSVTARLGEGVFGAVARNVAEAFPGSFGDYEGVPANCPEDAFCLTSTATMREE